MKCSNNREALSRYCLKHFVLNIVKSYKLDRINQLSLTEQLIIKLQKSEFSCFYSDIKIIPGFSASVDHRVPKNLGGTDDISNLEWVHYSINRIKSTLPEKEFVERFEDILVEINMMQGTI